ncbi:MAG: CSLREA domain-containing protein, partial [Chloroflexota bacterium]
MRFISVITLTVILSALVYISPTRAAITITVTTTADISAVDGVCSLQEAITAANINASVNECLHDGSAGTDTIEFAIGAPGSTQTIALASGLPTITEAVILDGTTQSGATGCNQITTPLIILDGTLTIGGVNGFLVSAGGNNSEIRGFVIQNFDRDGIEILASDMLVQCNFIGTNALGTAAADNGRHGITITAATSNNIIGTDGDGTNDDVEGNLISANINIGIDITSASLDNVVAGNIIGLDVTGTTTLGNRTHGVQVSGGSLNTRIGTNGDGTSDTLERNIISGNRNNGINLGTNSRNTTVAGNYIGTDINGTTTIGNGLHGVHGLNDSSSNIIGTNSDGAGDANEGNVISGNTADGIRFEVNVDDNVVAGNIIGLDLTGTVPLGNGRHGIAIASSNNRVGTDGNGISDISERNIISNNSTNGVVISANATGNTVAGNYIGTDITGTLDLGNGQNGVALGGGSNNNIIGTNGDGVGDASERNILSGNGQDGVGVFLGASNNTIAGNIMGLDVTGTLAIPNDRNGYFSNGNASSNIIGTNGDGVSDANERNIISGNGVHGVGIATGQDNVVAGNLIGTDITGTVALGNTQVGVVLNTTLNNRIGTNSDGLSDTLERNIISGNGIYGIRITGNGDANRISGNFVGTDINGTGVVSNATIGIFVDNGPDNTIIGSNADGVNDALESNLVSGNGGRGIYIINIGTTSTLIAANIVGLDITQTVALGNSSGIYVSDVAGITIGGSNYQLGNVVAGNTTEGILVRAGTA